MYNGTSDLISISSPNVSKNGLFNFVCPTNALRDFYSPDYTIWMDTIKESKYADTDEMFEKPIDPDYTVSKWFDDTHQQLLEVIKFYSAKLDDLKNDRVPGTSLWNLDFKYEKKPT